MQIFAKTRLTAIAAALAGAGFMVGCGSSVPNASPIIEDAKSDVVGKLLDKETNQPIVGAKVTVEGVDISDTTDDEGNFKLKDVPASTSIDGSVAGNYSVMVSLTKVSSPVDMKTCDTDEDESTICYPEMSMSNTLTVKASSAGDGGTQGVAIGEAGIVTVKDMMVGKLTGHMEGHVYSDETNAVTAATVEIWLDTNTNAAINEGTDMLVTTAKVTADDAETADVDESKFMIHGLEGGFNYVLRAKDDTKMVDIDLGAIASGTDADFDTMGHIVMTNTDTTGPDLAQMSIAAAGYDFASDATVAVTWTFDEPVALDAAGYRDSVAAGGNLYEDILVTYDGVKAGEVAKTVSWNTTGGYDQLTVTIDTPKVGSTYTIDVSGTNTNLEDAYGNADAGGYGGPGATTTFTVAYGGDAPGIPTVVFAQPTDLTTVDWDSNGPTLYWAAVSGASSYNIYRTATVGGVAMGTVRVANQAGNTLNDTLVDADAHGAGAASELVSEENAAVSYTWTVAAVNGDGVEGTASAATAAYVDKVAPQTTGASGCTAGGSLWGGDLVEIVFNEPMTESTAGASANYTNLPSGAEAVEWDEAAYTLSAHYSGAANAICGTATTVTVKPAVTDAAGVAVVATSGDTVAW